MNGVEEKWIVSRAQGANSVFRSGVNKAEQDLPVKQKRNTNEGSSSAVKYTNVVSKVAGLKKEARKHRNDWKPNDRDIPADFNVKQPNKGLAGCWIKAKVMQNKSDATSDTST